MNSPIASTATLALLAAPALAQDWTNLGGNAQRNGRIQASGPTSSTIAWTATPSSIIAWAPFIEGDRVVTVRESGFPQNGGAANDTIRCYSLASGAQQWSITLPFNGNTAQQWIAWIAGVNGGRIYASRSQNGSPQPVTALDITNGAILWSSTATTTAFAYDGAVFAPDGDPIVGDFNSLTRINSTDGATVWSVPRTCPVSGNCGPAMSSTGVFLDQAAPGGQVLTKLDPATGATLYSSTLMPGFTDQNSPFCNPSGSLVFFSRTQNNTSVDYLFCFADTGTALVELWRQPVRWTMSHEHGLASDDSIYTFLQNNEFVRLDALTGTVSATAGVLAPIGTSNLSPKTAVDAFGRVYVSNGWASSPATDGRMWAFSGDLSSNLFTLSLSRPNQGGPAIGHDGTLVMCDLTAVRGYRAPLASYCTAGTTTNGCTANLSGTGTPDANAGSGFVLNVADVEGAKTGLIFYGLSGAQAQSWGTSTSFLCVKPPTQRTNAQATGGTANACDGAMTLDWNAFIQTPGVLGWPFAGGEVVCAQAWFRDPPSPKTTMLSDALQFTVAP